MSRIFHIISKITSLIIIFIWTINLSGQSSGFQIKGQVLNENNKPVPFATVAIKNTSNGTVSDENGIFKISSNHKSDLQLQITCIGYQDQVISVSPNNNMSGLNIILKESSTSIDEVSVVKKSTVTIAREQAYTVSSIDAKPLQTQNLDVNQLLGRTAGVRIREEGGLGSGFSFSLNGFKGNQVKFFLDGVPMDNYGSSLTLNNIPVNLISSVEVYKGVVPIHLGSDALGGAVNVITDNSIKNYLDASYSYGSFNTHRAAFISRFTNKKSGITVNANVFYNYSDNDYDMTLSVASIENGGKYGPPEKIRRFHDAYESKTAQIEVGVMNKEFADQLFLGVIASGNYKELQTGHNMNIVIGEAFMEDKVIIPTLKYKKSDFLIKGLNINVFANYNFSQALSADTSSKKYDWYQNYEAKGVTATSGELAWYKTLFRYNDQSSLITANIAYHINHNHFISVNNTYSNFNRIGEDPIALSVVPFSKPNTLKKNISGIAYNINLFNKRLKTVAFAKLYLMESIGYEGERYSNSDTALTKITTLYNYQGYGIASTLYITKSTQIKASYEHTYRLPEPKEMFGNGLSLLSNLEIKPEESDNYNIGALSNNLLGNHRIVAEVGYLYRLPKNMIRYKAEGNDGMYVNQVSVKGYSIEAGLRYNFKGRLNAEINGTYQKMVHNNKTTPEGGTNYLYEQQLANMPFLFGNFMLGYQIKNFLGPQNTLSINWSTLFVEAFYLKSPSNGAPADKNDIPRQISNSASLSYSIKGGMFNVSFACTNLTNSELYDNWRLPKPGRAFNLKLRYYFSK